MQRNLHVAAMRPPAGDARPPCCPFLSRLVAAALLVPALCAAQTEPAGRNANPLEASDLAILRTHGDTISGRVIRNSCDAVLRPMISAVTPAMAVVTEIDPAGACSGSNPPGSLGVPVRHGDAWRLTTATIGSGFVLGAANGGHPDIVVQDPPFQRSCPVLRSDGDDDRVARACSGGRG